MMHPYHCQLRKSYLILNAKLPEFSCHTSGRRVKYRGTDTPEPDAMSTAVEHPVHPPPRTEPLPAEALPDIPAAEISRQALRKAIDDPAVREKVMRSARYQAKKWNLEAEELEAETYKRALENATHFDLSLGSPQSWLSGILSNIALETNRKRRKQPQTVSDPSGEFWSSVPGRDHAEQSTVRDTRLLIEKNIDRLPADLREICRMKHQKNMAYPEIANQLRITLANARQKVCRALNLVRQMMTDEIREVGS
jgi:RNA polymerase sigma factor (sigma-70 family)